MLSGDDAVWHVMRVAGGLDSLIVGEGQILSQVRQCYMHSVEEDGCGGKVLSRLLNCALAAGKRVRSETAIAKGSVSISSAAVELSEMLSQQDLQLPFSEARLAVVGAGKMTRLLITHLASRGLEKITIVNRSMARPQELAEQFPDVEIEIKLMDDLWDVVGRSDIIFTATSSVDYVIDEQKLEENGLMGGRPLMLVDIAVPRNVGDDCKVVSNVSVYTVHDCDRRLHLLYFVWRENGTLLCIFLDHGAHFFIIMFPTTAPECVCLQRRRSQGCRCQEYGHASARNARGRTIVAGRDRSLCFVARILVGYSHD
jgi:glutamyl-tRNA reductase